MPLLSVWWIKIYIDITIVVWIVHASLKEPPCIHPLIPTLATQFILRLCNTPWLPIAKSISYLHRASSFCTKGPSKTIDLEAWQLLSKFSDHRYPHWFFAKKWWSSILIWGASVFTNLHSSLTLGAEMAVRSSNDKGSSGPASDLKDDNHDATRLQRLNVNQQYLLGRSTKTKAGNTTSLRKEQKLRGAMSKSTLRQTTLSNLSKWW